MTVSLPYEPGRAAFASLERTAEDLAALADGRIEELPAAGGASSSTPRSLTSSATSSPTSRRPGRSSPGAIRFFEGAGDTRARSSSSPRRSASSPSGGTAAAGDRPRRAVARAVARAARDRPRHARRFRSPSKAAPASADAVRPGAARAPALRVAGGRHAATSTRTCARRSPASRGRTSTSSRGGCAAGRSARARSSRRRRTRSATAADPGARGAARRRRIRWPARPSTDPADAPGRPRPRGAAGRRPRRSRISARLRRGRGGCSTSSTAGLALGGELSADERRSRRSSAPTCGSRGAGETGRVAVLDLSRARTRRFESVFVLGLEEGSLPRRGQAIAVPRRRGPRRARGPHARPAHAARPGLARPLPLLHRVHPRDPTALPSSGRRRPTRGARASRARSGTRSRRSSTPDDVARWTRRRPLVAAHVAARRGAHRAGAPARARAARCGRADRGGCARGRATAGSAGSSARRRAFHEADAARASARARRAVRQVDVQRDRARALRGLLLGLVLRAADRPEGDRPAGRRDAARLGRPHDAAPLLRRPAEGGRLGSRRGVAARRRARVPRRMPRRTRSPASRWR